MPHFSRTGRLVIMRTKVLFSCLMSLACAPILRSATVTPLHQGWQLQSACKLQATGDAIAIDSFQPEGWLKTTVPSTVLASQAAAGVFPDPYFGMNLRQIPGTTYPIGRVFAEMPMPSDSPYHCG
jgi:exo-1,4-beta-D-glucosaminidase